MYRSGLGPVVNGPLILDFDSLNDQELKLNRKRKHVLGIYLQSLASNCSEQLSFVCEEQKLGWDPYYRLIYSIFCDPSRFVNLYGFMNWLTLSFFHQFCYQVKSNEFQKDMKLPI